jgi:hypothetical protein
MAILRISLQNFLLFKNRRKHDGHVELSKLPNLWNYYWHLNWNPALVKGP